MDGDGRKDIEWAVAEEGGSIQFGVTTASGVTIAKTATFTSGGQRAVSIGTLSTGQTVALPTDVHAALLYVIHDCRWVKPKFPSTNSGTDFLTAYYDPAAAGGRCVGRRLYQVVSTPTGEGRETLTGVTEHISPDGQTVEEGRQVTFLRNTKASMRASKQNGDGACSPSPHLLPSVDR